MNNQNKTIIVILTQYAFVDAFDFQRYFRVLTEKNCLAPDTALFCHIFKCLKTAIAKSAWKCPCHCNAFFFFIFFQCDNLNTNLHHRSTNIYIFSAFYKNFRYGLAATSCDCNSKFFCTIKLIFSRITQLILIFSCLLV